MEQTGGRFRHQHFCLLGRASDACGAPAAPLRPCAATGAQESRPVCREVWTWCCGTYRAHGALGLPVIRQGWASGSKGAGSSQAVSTPSLDAGGGRRWKHSTEEEGVTSGTQRGEQGFQG